MRKERRYTRAPEWYNDLRREPRWREDRTALTRVGDREWLGRTRDLSRAGLGLNLYGAVLSPGDAVAVQVVFEQDVVEFVGRVAHAAPTPRGSTLGIRCEPDPGVAAFVTRRYTPEPEAVGSVK